MHHSREDRTVIHEQLAEIAVRKAWHEDQVARHDELRADAELVAKHSANIDMISEASFLLSFLEIINIDHASRAGSLCRTNEPLSLLLYSFTSFFLSQREFGKVLR
ncbi:hypothetical protein VNO80_23734 [Phaseolus coccineus]|uniref:Uncharacterized protein n=1 Tax=Phaseolus coccineus TaxID=3886 RepID=A0AAN9M627_PHACN